MKDNIWTTNLSTKSPTIILYVIQSTGREPEDRNFSYALWDIGGDCFVYAVSQGNEPLPEWVVVA